jgi:succinate dehydrogenase flavin-adding protein (antitoxin of CptAB toxin-antitoxin module)
MEGFGKYKHNIDSILINSYKDKKTFKSNFHVIMGGMKLSEDFREFFTLYNDIENKKFKSINEANEYLTESVNILRTKLKSLKTPYKIFKQVFSKRKNLCENYTNEIYKKLDYLIFSTKLKSVENKIQIKEELTNHMTQPLNESISKSVDSKILSHVLSKNYNEKYSTLTTEEKYLVKKVLSCDDKEIKNQIRTLKEENLKKINSILNESNDDNLSAKLVKTKDKVKQMGNSRNTLLKLQKLNRDLV